MSDLSKDRTEEVIDEMQGDGNTKKLDFAKELIREQLEEAQAKGLPEWNVDITGDLEGPIYEWLKNGIGHTVSVNKSGPKFKVVF